MAARASWLVFFGVGVSIASLASCSDWPGLNAKERGGAGNGVGSTAPGICSGTPTPCEVLSGADCAANPGCSDRGTCGGVASGAGQSCATAFSLQACNAITGCFWNPSCTGTPFGTCSAFSEQACLTAKGCVWTNTGTGGTSSGVGGTTSGTCSTFGASCRSSSDCDCSLSCVQQCSTCPATCGRSCQQDADCSGAMGQLGVATPFCLKQVQNPTPPYTGICSSFH